MKGKLTIPVGEDCRTHIQSKQRVAGIKNNESHCKGVRKELSRTQNALATKEESKLILLKQWVRELRWTVIAWMEPQTSRGVKCIWPAKTAFSLTPFWSCLPWHTHLFLPPSRGPFTKEHVKFETSWNPTQPEVSWLPWLKLSRDKSNCQASKSTGNVSRVPIRKVFWSVTSVNTKNWISPLQKMAGRK